MVYSLEELCEELRDEALTYFLEELGLFWQNLRNFIKLGKSFGKSVGWVGGY